MYHAPTTEELKRLPPLQATLHLPPLRRKIYEEFLLNDSSWYAAEYNSKGRLFFGYVIIGSDFLRGAWTYFTLDFLLDLKNERGDEVLRRRVKRKPASAAHIPQIGAGYNLRGESGYEAPRVPSGYLGPQRPDGLRVN